MHTNTLLFHFNAPPPPPPSKHSLPIYLLLEYRVELFRLMLLYGSLSLSLYSLTHYFTTAAATTTKGLSYDYANYQQLNLIQLKG